MGAKSLDLTNKKFGSLIALKLLKKRKNKQKIWKCKCDCGNIKNCCAYELNKGYTISCGCAKFKTGNTHFNWKGCGELSSHHLTKIKLSAKNRKLEFNVSIEYLWDLFLKQDRKCALTGLEIKFKKSHRDEVSASLDRIDPNIGYIEGNVQWVHKDINTMKFDFSQEEFINYCKLVCIYKG